MRGQKGTIKSVAATGVITDVVWDDRKYTLNPMNENVQVLNSDQEEIDQALAVLKKHGKVEFKKNKPPFQNILVGGVGDYTATVMERFIIVGCQTITLDKFDELAAAVAKARAYSKEN
jgi:hypothetical protein